MSAATVSDRAAEVVAWVESYNAPPTRAPDCIGDALVVRRVEVHTLDEETFEAIRTVGREGWGFASFKGSEWLVYEPNEGVRVVLFRK